MKSYKKFVASLAVLGILFSFGGQVVKQDTSSISFVRADDEYH